MLDVMNVHLKIDFQKRFSKFSLYNTYQTFTRQLLESFKKHCTFHKQRIKSFTPVLKKKKKYTKYPLYLFQFINETNLPPMFTLQSTPFPIIAPMEDFDYPDILRGDVSERGKLDTSIGITRFPCSFSFSVP